MCKISSEHSHPFGKNLHKSLKEKIFWTHTVAPHSRPRDRRDSTHANIPINKIWLL